MKTPDFVEWLAALAALSAITLATGEARAHGDVDVDRGSSERSRRGAGTISEAQTPSEGRSAGASDRALFTLSLDLVMGWGKVPFAVQNLPTTETRAITYTYGAATPSGVESFILTGSIDVAKHLSVAVRLPATFASFSPSGSASRSTTSFGNVELDAVYRARAARGMILVGAFGVAVPTAQGDEVPRDLLEREASAVDEGAYDRFSLNRAAELARGNEDDSLFEPKRLALVSKISLFYGWEAFRVEPSFKVESLIATANSAGAPYVGELVPALRLAYGLRKVVELAIRGWASVRFAAAAEDRGTTAVIEPGIVLRFATVVPYAGVIVPLLGSPLDRSFLGVRLGVMASF